MTLAVISTETSFIKFTGYHTYKLDKNGKDPGIRQLATLRKKRKPTIRDIVEGTGLSESCVRRYFAEHGYQTRFPRHMTYKAIETFLLKWNDM